jgi:hypothetical protein
MVDALKRARRWLLPPSGCAIDLRPAEVVPEVELQLPDGAVVPVGELRVDAERTARYHAADKAVAEVVARGLFTTEREQQFFFHYYAPSVNELRDYLASKWRHTHFDGDVYSRAIDRARAHPDARVVLRELVGIRTLRPVRAKST